MKEISVIGHKNPDTDCTLSAIIMAEYLEKKGYFPTPYIQGELNKETEYILEKYDIPRPAIQTILDTTTETCLVDHNEGPQAPDNLSELNVSWLIDHHKIKFETAIPLYMRVEPICSTASILYKMFIESGFEISQKTAIMMLACIMSDSLFWKSPTTTDEDKHIAKRLQVLAQVDDLEEFSMSMFTAKSDLGDMPILDIIQYDYKVFEVNGKKIGIGTLETTNPNYGLGKKDEILKGFKLLKKEQDLDFIMLCIVDILKEQNITIIGDGDIQDLESMFNLQVQDNLADLGNRLSRKKQLAPIAMNYFNFL